MMTGIRFCFTRPDDGGVSIVHGVAIEQMAKFLNRDVTETEYLERIKAAIPSDALDVRQLADDEVLPGDRSARSAWRNGAKAVEVDQTKAATLALETLTAEVKAECQRRIYAVVDQLAQMNLAAAAGGGALDESQMAIYRSGLAWIGSMRTKCGELIAAGDQTFADDKHWQVPDPEIIALGQAF